VEPPRHGRCRFESYPLRSIGRPARAATGIPRVTGTGTLEPNRTAPPKLWRSLRDLPRPVVVLLVGVAVNRLGTLLPIFLILYLHGHGYSPARAGLVLTVYGIGAVMGEFASGVIMDRIGPRYTIMLSMVISGTLVAGLAVVHQFAALAALCFAIGATTYLYWPAAMSLLAVLTPGERLVISSAAYRLALNVGATAAPLVGVMLLLLADSYALLFVVDAGTSLIFALLAALLLQDVRPERAAGAEPGTAEPGTPRRSTNGYLAVLRDRRFVLVLGAALAVAMVEVQYQAVLPLQIADRGLPLSLYAAVLAVNGAMVIALELPVTPLVLRMPTRAALAAGAVLIGLGISLFGLSAAPWLLLVGAVVWTAGEIISAPSTIAYPALVAAPGLQNRYIGMLSTSQTIGFTIGPAVGTVLYQLIGSAMWSMCLILGLLAGAGMWVGVVRPANRAEPALAAAGRADGSSPMPAHPRPER
jgi:MFS family permease